MIIDKSLVLDDAHAVTASTTSDSYVDTLAAGTSYTEALFCQFLVDTAFAGTSNCTMQLALQSAADAAFGTMVLTQVIDQGAGLPKFATAGLCYQAQMAPGHGRYLRAYYTVTGNVFTAGKIDCRLVKDIDIGMDKIY